MDLVFHPKSVTAFAPGKKHFMERIVAQHFLEGVMLVPINDHPDVTKPADAFLGWLNASGKTAVACRETCGCIVEALVNASFVRSLETHWGQPAGKNVFS